MNPPSFVPAVRNQFRGRVASIVEASVLSEVEVRLADGQLIVATISARDIGALDLRVGAGVPAILKANDVAVAVV